MSVNEVSHRAPDSERAARAHATSSMVFVQLLDPAEAGAICDSLPRRRARPGARRTANRNSAAAPPRSPTTLSRPLSPIQGVQDDCEQLRSALRSADLSAVNRSLDALVARVGTIRTSRLSWDSAACTVPELMEVERAAVRLQRWHRSSATRQVEWNEPPMSELSEPLRAPLPARLQPAPLLPAPLPAPADEHADEHADKEPLKLRFKHWQQPWYLSVVESDALLAQEEQQLAKRRDRMEAVVEELRDYAGYRVRAEAIKWRGASDLPHATLRVSTPLPPSSPGAQQSARYGAQGVSSLERLRAVNNPTLTTARMATYSTRRHLSGRATWHKHSWGRSKQTDWRLPPPSMTFVWPRPPSRLAPPGCSTSEPRLLLGRGGSASRLLPLETHILAAM